MIGNIAESFVTSSVLILVILFLRKLCRGKIKSSLQYGIWILVAVKLLLVPVPFWESPFSVMNLMERDREERQGAVPGTDSNTEATYILEDKISPNPVILENEVIESIYIPKEARVNASGEYKNGRKSFLDAVPYVIYINAILLAVWMLVSNMRFYGKLKKSRMPYENENYRENGRNPRIYLIEKLDTPCLYGTGIYLPLEMEQDEKRMRHILAHETAHYRHGDFLWSFLRLLCLALNWYNPFVWMAAAAVKQDCELACDEAAIKVLGEEERIPYGETLIQLVGEKRPKDILTVSTQMTGDKKEIKTRISLIAKKPVTVVSVVIVMAFVLIAAVSCTFTGKKEEKAAEDVKRDTSTVTDRKDGQKEKEEEILPDEEVFEPEESSAEAESPEVFTGNDPAEEFTQLTKEGTFSVYVRSIARSAGEIDRFSLPADIWPHEEEPSLYGGLAFSENCTFSSCRFNPELGTMEFKEKDFDSFVDEMSWDDVSEVECKVICKDGLVTNIVAYNTYCGITYSEPTESRDYYDLFGTEGYELVRTYEADIAEADGIEKIKVYSGNMGDGDSGYVIVESEENENGEGEILWVETAHQSRAGWNTIYLGETDGEAYLFTLQIEVRGNYGELIYHAFRLDRDGNPLILNGAKYVYEKEDYKAENFKQWHKSMSAYKNRGFLLLSTQDGALKVGAYPTEDDGASVHLSGSSDTYIPAPEQTDFELIDLERMIEEGMY